MAPLNPPVTANRIILEPDITQLFRRTIESEVTNRPGSRV